jgi:hypothetical protein
LGTGHHQGSLGSFDGGFPHGDQKGAFLGGLSMIEIGQEFSREEFPATGIGHHSRTCSEQNPRPPVKRDRGGSQGRGLENFTGEQGKTTPAEGGVVTHQAVFDRPFVVLFRGAGGGIAIGAYRLSPE